MRMKTKMILLFALTLLLIGCNNFCPGLPAKYDAYLPYTAGQQIVFNNSNNDTLALIINDLILIKDHEISTCGMCECDPQFISVILREKDNPLLFKQMKIRIYLNNSTLSSYITTNNLDNARSQDYFEKKTPVTSLTDTIYLTNIDTPAKIDNITIVKGKGVVSFYDITTNHTWKLIEK